MLILIDLINYLKIVILNQLLKKKRPQMKKKNRHMSKDISRDPHKLR